MNLSGIILHPLLLETAARLPVDIEEANKQRKLIVCKIILVMRNSCHRSSVAKVRGPQTEASVSVMLDSWNGSTRARPVRQFAHFSGRSFADARQARLRRMDGQCKHSRASTRASHSLPSATNGGKLQISSSGELSSLTPEWVETSHVHPVPFTVLCATRSKFKASWKELSKKIQEKQFPRACWRFSSSS